MTRQKELTSAEQLAAFAEEYEQRNAGLNGRHDPNAPGKRQERPGSHQKGRRGISPASAAGRLLEAAKTFPGPFGLTALILTAWDRWPELFGLSGAEKIHPDSHKCRYLLDGKRGLVARGLLERLPSGLMRVVGGQTC